jgi:hypothetical protein
VSSTALAIPSATIPTATAMTANARRVLLLTEMRPSDCSLADALRSVGVQVTLAPPAVQALLAAVDRDPPNAIVILCDQPGNLIEVIRSRRRLDATPVMFCASGCGTAPEDLVPLIAASAECGAGG